MDKLPIRHYILRDGYKLRTAYLARERAEVGELVGRTWFINEEEWKIVKGKMRRVENDSE